MSRTFVRRLGTAGILGALASGVLALFAQPADAGAQTTECWIRTCTTLSNGQKVCIETPIKCPTQPLPPP